MRGACLQRSLTRKERGVFLLEIIGYECTEPRMFLSEKSLQLHQVARIGPSNEESVRR